MAKPYPAKEVIRRLEKAGYHKNSQKGSHIKFVKVTDEGIRTAIVPNHKEISHGTLRSILNQAGLSFKEFEDL